MSIRTVLALLLALGAAWAQPQDSDAVRQAREALAAAEAEREALPLAEALALERLATALTRERRREDAEPLLRQALAIRESVQGTQHRDVVTTLGRLANNLRFQRRSEEAEAHFLRAIEAGEAWYGDAHPQVISLLYDRGSMRASNRHYDSALADLDRAAAMLERSRASGIDHLRLRIGERAGTVLNALGRHEEALERLGGLLDWARSRLGEDIALDLTLLALERAHRELDQHEAADALVARHLAIVAAEYGESSQPFLDALVRHTQDALAYGRDAMTESLLQRRLPLTVALHGHGSPQHARVLLTLAGVLTSQGKIETARPVLDEAAGMVMQLAADGEPFRIELLRLEAEVLLAEERHDEAVAAYERLVARLQAEPDDHAPWLEFAQQDLESARLQRRAARLGPQPLPARYVREGLVYNSQPLLPERFDMTVTRVDRAHVEHEGERIALWALADRARDAGAATVLVRGMGDEELCGGVLLAEHGLLVFFEQDDGEAAGIQLNFTLQDTLHTLWQGCRVRLAPDPDEPA